MILTDLVVLQNSAFREACPCSCDTTERPEGGLQDSEIGRNRRRVSHLSQSQASSGRSRRIQEDEPAAKSLWMERLLVIRL